MNTTHQEDLETLAEVTDTEKVVHSVVKGLYKTRYAERAETARIRKGISEKAAKRCCLDWLAQELASRTLDKKAVLNVEAFEAILDANEVPHRHWNRTTKGWQGRLRMSGRLALQRVVAENSELKLPDGTSVTPPKAWVERVIR